MFIRVEERRQNLIYVALNDEMRLPKTYVALKEMPSLTPTMMLYLDISFIHVNKTIHTLQPHPVAQTHGAVVVKVTLALSTIFCRESKSFTVNQTINLTCIIQYI